MIAPDLKTAVDTLSPDERHELSHYLARLELEQDPDYWKTVRKRAEAKDAERWVNADHL